MPPRYAPIRIHEGIRQDLLFIKRELAVKYNEDFTLSDVVRSLIQGYSGNPKLAENLREIIDRRPSLQIFPGGNPSQSGVNSE